MEGTELASSYEKEEATLLTGLDWTRTNCTTESIHSGAHDTQYIRQRLENRKGSNDLILVLGHKGIRDHEATDELAKEVAAIIGTPQ